jgi:hypothetical protein
VKADLCEVDVQKVRGIAVRTAYLEAGEKLNVEQLVLASVGASTHIWSGRSWNLASARCVL